MRTGARSHYEVTLTSDASGTWGCGAFTSGGEWFQVKWPDSWKDTNIMVKELLPIVLAVALWGDSWAGKLIRCRCDNAAVVEVVNSGVSRCEKAMHLVRSAFIFQAMHEVSLWAVHIPGVENRSADALSRDNSSLFFFQNPEARERLTAIPPALLQALVLQSQDWTLQNWIDVLAACSPKAWQTRHNGRTEVLNAGTCNSALRAN